MSEKIVQLNEDVSIAGRPHSYQKLKTNLRKTLDTTNSKEAGSGMCGNENEFQSHKSPVS